MPASTSIVGRRQLQAVGVLDAVLQRHDHRARRGGPCDLSRRGRRRRTLDADQDDQRVGDGRRRLGQAGLQGRRQAEPATMQVDAEPGRAAYPQALKRQGADDARPADKAHVGPGGGQAPPDVAADRPGAVDDEDHGSRPCRGRAVGADGPSPRGGLGEPGPAASAWRRRSIGKRHISNMPPRLQAIGARTKSWSQHAIGVGAAGARGLEAGRG